MLTDKDIQKLKEVFATKDDFDYLKLKVNNIEVSVYQLNEKVDRIDKRDIEDSSAYSSLLLQHDRRLKKIEKLLKIKA